ncbi:MAG: hypothetical protein M3357_13530 [Actinomycetota bacterium]|nr:hypothetical protein [Actinomycetota bacterium]
MVPLHQAGHAPYIAACAAGHAASVTTGSYRDAFVAERSRQSEWITTRLGLEAPPPTLDLERTAGA